MFIVTPPWRLGQAPLGAALNGIWHPTGLQRWGRQRDAMPLRWSLAEPVAPAAINTALQKELFALSPRERCV